MTENKIWVRICFSVLVFLVVVWGCNRADRADYLQGEETELAVLQLNNPNKLNLNILEIGDVRYTNADFVHYLTVLAGADAAALKEESVSRLFDDFCDEKVLLAGASREGLALTEEEKHDYLDRLQRDIPPEEAVLLDNPRSRQVFFERLLVEKRLSGLTKDIQITSKEIADYFASNKREFLRSSRVRVSQILIKTDHEAVEILHKVRGADEETFRRFAREFSIGPEAGRGGDMGFYEMNQLPYEMEKVIFSLQTGQVSDVFASVYGQHIFRLDERLEAKLMTEAEAAAGIRARIVDRKREEVLSAYLNELRQNLEWKTHVENLPFTYRRKSNE